MKIQEIVNSDISINAPESENNIRSKMPGYNLVFEFPTCPNPKEKNLAFAAYIKKVTDAFNPSYDSSRSIYGRMDTIPVYSKTTRTITFDLDIPSYGLLHSREIANKIQTLVRNTYPSYQPNGNVNIISSPPLVKIFFSNFINDVYKQKKTGDLSVLGYFGSSISISHDLSDGVFVRNQGFEAYAKNYSLNFTLNVLHTYTPGFVSDSQSGAYTNPVNILQGEKLI